MDEKRILKLGDIRRKVRAALANRRARALLFGSYARGEATSKSDVDLLVIKKLDLDWLTEASEIKRKLNFGCSVDLILVDEVKFATFKNMRGTVYHEAVRDGVWL